MASRAKDFLTTSPRNALECIITGKVDDIKPLVDEDIVRHLEDLESRLATYDRHVSNRMRAFMSAATYTCDADMKSWRKEFAIRVMESGEWQTPFFALLSKQFEGFGLVEWLRTLSENEKLTDSMLDTLLERI